MTKKQTHAQGQEQTSIITGAFSPSTALLQMLIHFGDQLSPSDWSKLHDEQFYVKTTLEGWESVTQNLAIYISEDHAGRDNGEIVTGCYAGINQATPQLLTLVSRAFGEVNALLELDALVTDRVEALGGAA